MGETSSRATKITASRAPGLYCQRWGSTQQPQERRPTSSGARYFPTCVCGAVARDFRAMVRPQPRRRGLGWELSACLNCRANRQQVDLTPPLPTWTWLLSVPGPTPGWWTTLWLTVRRLMEAQLKTSCFEGELL